MNDSTIDRVGKMTSVEFYEGPAGQKRALSEVKNFSSSAGMSGGRLQQINKKQYYEDEEARKMREMTDFYQRDFPLHQGRNQIREKRKKSKKLSTKKNPP